MHGKKDDEHLVFPYYSVKPPLELSRNEKIRWLIEQRKQMNGHLFIYIDNPNNPTGDFPH